MADDKKKVTKARRPSALKRDLQGEKRRLKNKTYKSTVSSAIKAFEASLSQKDCSLMDKGVKKGIYPKNKASRTKSNFAVKVPA